MQDFVIGTEVRIIGRVQSRNYEKKHEDGTVEPRIAYEVSIASLELVNENDNNNEDDNTENYMNENQEEA